MGQLVIATTLHSSQVEVSADDENNDMCAKCHNNGCSRVVAHGAWGSGQVVVQCVCDTETKTTTCFCEDETKCNNAQFIHRQMSVPTDSKLCHTGTVDYLGAISEMAPKFVPKETCAGHCCWALSANTADADTADEGYLARFGCGEKEDCESGCQAIPYSLGLRQVRTGKICYCNTDQCNDARFLTAAILNNYSTRPFANSSFLLLIHAVVFLFN